MLHLLTVAQGNLIATLKQCTYIMQIRYAALNYCISENGKFIQILKFRNTNQRLIRKKLIN
jgi:hypothetical protein